MSERTYYQRNKEKDYYKNNEAVLREKARNKYSGLSEEEKIRKYEALDTKICLNKINKNCKNIKKNIVRLKK